MNKSVSQKNILSIETARRAIVRSVIQLEKPVIGAKKLVCKVIATRKEEKKVVRQRRRGRYCNRERQRLRSGGYMALRAVHIARGANIVFAGKAQNIHIGRWSVQLGSRQ